MLNRESQKSLNPRHPATANRRFNQLWSRYEAQAIVLGLPYVAISHIRNRLIAGAVLDERHRHAIDLERAGAEGGDDLLIGHLVYLDNNEGLSLRRPGGLSIRASRS